MANKHTRIQAYGIHPGAHTFDITPDRPLPLTERSPVTWQIETENPFALYSAEIRRPMQSASAGPMNQNQRRTLS
jgi:hypothetical protein